MKIGERILAYDKETENFILQKMPEDPADRPKSQSKKRKKSLRLRLNRRKQIEEANNTKKDTVFSKNFQQTLESLDIIESVQSLVNKRRAGNSDASTGQGDQNNHVIHPIIIQQTNNSKTYFNILTGTPRKSSKEQSPRAENTSSQSGFKGGVVKMSIGQLSGAKLRLNLIPTQQLKSESKGVIMNSKIKELEHLTSQSLISVDDEILPSKMQVYMKKFNQDLSSSNEDDSSISRHSRTQLQSRDGELTQLPRSARTPISISNSKNHLIPHSTPKIDQFPNMNKFLMESIPQTTRNLESRGPQTQVQSTYLPKLKAKKDIKGFIQKMQFQTSKAQEQFMENQPLYINQIPFGRNLTNNEVQWDIAKQFSSQQDFFQNKFKILNIDIPKDCSTLVNVQKKIPKYTKRTNSSKTRFTEVQNVQFQNARIAFVQNAPTPSKQISRRWVTPRIVDLNQQIPDQQIKSARNSSANSISLFNHANPENQSSSKLLQLINFNTIRSKKQN